MPPPSLDSYYLMKPSLPLTDPLVLEGSKNWMFIPKNMVT